MHAICSRPRSAVGFDHVSLCFRLIVIRDDLVFTVIQSGGFDAGIMEGDICAVRAVIGRQSCAGRLGRLAVIRHYQLGPVGTGGTAASVKAGIFHIARGIDQHDPVISHAARRYLLHEALQVEGLGRVLIICDGHRIDRAGVVFRLVVPGDGLRIEGLRQPVGAHLLAAGAASPLVDDEVCLRDRLVLQLCLQSVKPQIGPVGSRIGLARMHPDRRRRIKVGACAVSASYIRIPDLIISPPDVGRIDGNGILPHGISKIGGICHHRDLIEMLLLQLIKRKADGFTVCLPAGIVHPGLLDGADHFPVFCIGEHRSSVRILLQ